MSSAKIGEVKIDGDVIGVYQESYSTGNIAISLYDNDGPYARLSVNPDRPKDLKEGEFAVKDWSENHTLARIMRDSGLFINTGKLIFAGHELPQVWKVKAK